MNLYKGRLRHNSVYFLAVPRAFSTGYFSSFFSIFAITICFTSRSHASAIKNANAKTSASSSFTFSISASSADFDAQSQSEVFWIMKLLPISFITKLPQTINYFIHNLIQKWVLGVNFSRLRHSYCQPLLY
jgi:hypothetical protein